MDRQEFHDKTAFLFDGADPIGIKLYFVLEDAGEVLIRFADISPEVANDLRSQFIGYLRTRLVLNEGLNFQVVSEADDIANSVYHYDIDVTPPMLAPLYEVNESEIFAMDHEREASFDDFSFDDDDIRKIRGFVICLGNELNKVVLYKKHYPISVLKQGTYYGLIFSETRLEKFTDNLIKINDTVEFMLVDGELIVLNLKAFQNYFGYDQIIRNKAEANLVTIEAVNILEDIGQLRELAVELKYAKRIMRIRQESPVLNIPFPDIRAFIQGHPKLRNKLKFNADLTRLSLQSRASKELFIKMLNDDFLRSELTQLLYDSERKATLDNVEEPGE